MSLFVTFEGPDGAGKSTQVAMVTARLEDAGKHVVVTREPGGTPLGERIRDVLLEPGEHAIVPRAEALLMSAARAQHVSDVIEPSLRDGAIVLCDRFVDSTLAYQGAGHGLPEVELNQLQEFVLGSLVPDITVLIDLPAEWGIRRLRDSGIPLNRLDQSELAFHERVRTWYVEAARKNPERWVVCDASRPADDLASEIAMMIIARSRARDTNGKSG